MVSEVLDHVRGVDRRQQHAQGLVRPAGAHQARVEPVERRHAGVVVARPGLEAPLPELRGPIELAEDVVREREVVGDVAVRRAARRAARTGRSIGLEAVRSARGERLRVGEDLDRGRGLPQREEPVPEMPPQAVALRVRFERARVPLHRVGEEALVGEPATDPDGRLFGRVELPVRVRRVDLRLQPRAGEIPGHGRGERRADQRQGDRRRRT